jgi:hypothetical protein
VNYAWNQSLSNSPLREVGEGQESLTLSEEERASHVHIIGTTGEGKSKFIELMIRGDIAAGHGVCLLDPTDRAETAYSVLRYCASIGFKKVCLIDPHTIRTHNRVTCIQPFDYRPAQRDAVVTRIMDSIRIMFSERDADTPRIRRYLPALLRILLQSGLTLNETLYFSDYDNPDYIARRKFIYSKAPEDRDSVTLKSAFRTVNHWENHFSSTINRLDPLWQTAIGYMLSSDVGVDFVKMITEGWVILVSLDADEEIEPIHTRLLGNVVINELLSAMTRVIRWNKQYGKTYRKPYYLYVDEAGEYANDRLLRVLEMKRKTNFRVTISHQSFSQFTPDAGKRIEQITKTKVMFDTPGHDDRMRMTKALGYGGEIPAVMAAYVNSNLPQRHVIIKKPKQTPVRIKIVDVPEISEEQVSAKQEEAFTQELLSQPWNKTPDAIRKQIEQRFSAVPPAKGARPERASGSNPMWNRAQRSPAASKQDGAGPGSKKG